jgi:hypothetical protein
VRFFFGLIGEGGNRYVVTGLATPTLKSMEDLTDGGEQQENCDWGNVASDEAKLVLADLLIGAIDPHYIRRHPEILREYVDEVIDKMDTGHKWMLSEEDIEKWLASKVKVQ